MQCRKLLVYRRGFGCSCGVGSRGCGTASPAFPLGRRRSVLPATVSTAATALVGGGPANAARPRWTAPASASTHELYNSSRGGLRNNNAHLAQRRSYSAGRLVGPGSLTARSACSRTSLTWTRPSCSVRTLKASWPAFARHCGSNPMALASCHPCQHSRRRPRHLQQMSHRPCRRQLLRLRPRPRRSCLRWLRLPRWLRPLRPSQRAPRLSSVHGPWSCS